MKERLKRNIPNIITLSRVVSFVAGFILFLNGNIALSICLYIYGSVSDAFDGYFARKWNAYSKFGAYLDSISDKFYALSIIIITIINGNYLMIIIAMLELIISIINYLTIKKNGSTHTERVGKFKMTFEFMSLVAALLSIEIKFFWYLFIVLLVPTVYFQIQSINAYINQMNNKKIKLNINEKDYKGKSIREKISLLLKEFMYYLLHPVKIIK